MENMNYEFKDIATLDMVEAVADTANVLIEENGVIKRAPKSEVGRGSGNGVSSWNDLTDKPFDSGVGQVDIVPLQEVTFSDGVAQLSNVKDPCYDLKLCTDPGNFMATLEINDEVIEAEVRYYYVAVDTTFGYYNVDIGNGCITLQDDSTVQNGDTVTVRLYGIAETIKPLDEKYLPINIPRLNLEDNVSDMVGMIPMSVQKNGKLEYENIELSNCILKTCHNTYKGRYASSSFEENEVGDIVLRFNLESATWFKISARYNVSENDYMYLRLNDETSCSLDVPDGSCWCIIGETIDSDLILIKVYDNGGNCGNVKEYVFMFSGSIDIIDLDFDKTDIEECLDIYYV